MLQRTDEEYEKMTNDMISECGAKIAFKEDSKLLKFLNIFIRLFNKRFMTDYVNVIGTTVWFPTKKGYEEMDKKWKYCFMKHELHHVKSTKQKTIPGMIMYYGFPQSLSLLTLPSCVACIIFFGFLTISSLVLAVLTLLFLIPWPAVFRVSEELDAEVEAEAARIEEGLVSTKKNLFRNVCSLEYYNPMYKESWAEKEFDKRLDKFLNID